MSRESELAWAAGLFEGEGCITYRRKQQTPLLSLSMTDQDVVDRFHEIVGVGNRHEKNYKRPEHSHFQTQYVWYCPAIQDVRHVIALFLPYFGDRRRARALDVLDAYNTADVRRYRRDECVRGHPVEQYAVYYSGKKYCRECNRLKANERYHAKKKEAAAR